MNRFALSATGLMAATASAAPVEIDVTLDYWAGEAGIQIFNSASSLVASFAVVSGYLSATGMSIIAFSVNGSSAYSSGYSMTLAGDFAAGDYTIVLTDTYGDGWSWNGVAGGISGYGGAASGSAIFFSTGSSTSGSFTVVPAPAGLALLGLAGLSRRRRG